MNKSAQSAMQQINLKNYPNRFALSGKPITKVAINFDSNKGNIENWVIEKAYKQEGQAKDLLKTNTIIF